jgi:hypothetical protein
MDSSSSGKSGLDYVREEFATDDAYRSLLKRVKNAYLDIMVYLPQRHATDAYDACYDSAIDLLLAGSICSKRNIRRDAWRQLDSLHVRDTDVFSALGFSDDDGTTTYDVEDSTQYGAQYTDSIEQQHDLLQRLLEERGLSQGEMDLDSFLQFVDSQLTLPNRAGRPIGSGTRSVRVDSLSEIGAL